MKKVTVIIPVYNVEQYLGSCLDSVMAQTYKNLEVIVVDDASPDGSGAIAEDFAAKDERIKVIHKNVNHGLSAARNVGIKNATGDFIFFIDSDDKLRSETISRLIEKAKDGNLPLTGYDLEFMPEGKIKHAEQAYGSFSSLSEWLNAFPKLFATKFNFAWGKLYRADILKHNGIEFRQKISLVEDLLFNLQYYEHCTGFYLDEYNGYIYRQTGASSLSKKFDPKMIDWNVMSFTTLVAFLNAHNMYNSENKAHLLANACNNFKYNFHLVALSKYYSLQDKERIINEALDRPFVAEAMRDGNASVRCYQKFITYLLRHNHISTYICLEKLRRLI